MYKYLFHLGIQFLINFKLTCISAGMVMLYLLLPDTTFV